MERLVEAVRTPLRSDTGRVGCRLTDCHLSSVKRAPTQSHPTKGVAPFGHWARAARLINPQTGALTHGLRRVLVPVDGSPPAKAGLKVGDIIAAVNGTYISDAESFRRALRLAIARNETTFTVVRGGKDVPVTASFLGWEPPALKPAK